MSTMAFAPGLFAGQVAVVTGGTSGLGAATAQVLAQLGAEVHAVGLGADPSIFEDPLIGAFRRPRVGRHGGGRVLSHSRGRTR